MTTIDYLTGPSASLFWPGVAAGFAIAIQGALLSVLVVLKRMAFIGQGVSHAAFGGVGLAVALGLAGGAAFGLIAAFCVASAWAIAWAGDRSRSDGPAGSRRAGASTDTIIGVALVGAMALGAILVAAHARFSPGAGPGPSWEQALFGSILAVGPTDAAIAWASCAVTTLALWWWRRPLLFWAFDEVAAQSGGAPTRFARYLLLTLLAVAVVTAMKLAGVVLATALLTLPGAAALSLSRRLAPVLAISAAVGVAGLALGLTASFEFDMPPGACVVACLIALYALASVVGPGALRRPAPTPEPAR